MGAEKSRVYNTKEIILGEEEKRTGNIGIVNSERYYLNICVVTTAVQPFRTCLTVLYLPW